MEEVGFNLEELIASSGLERLAAMEKGLNAVYTNDETKRKFQVLAREVFKKFKALQPNKLLNQYTARKDAINAIYAAIENNVQSADVSEFMQRIQAVIDESIEHRVAEAAPEMGNTGRPERPEF